MTNLPLRGIFFDLDDTLIDYTQALKEAMVAITPFAQEYYPTLTTTRLYESMAQAYQQLFGYGTVGYTELATLETPALRRRLTQGSLDRLGIQDESFAEELWQQYAEAESKCLKPYDDTEWILAALKPHFVLGIITNGPARLQREKLTDLGLLHWFDVILTDSEHGCPKPHFSIFEHAAGLAQLRSGELLFVGDTAEADIAGANGAGWRSVHLSATPSLEATFSLTSRREILNLPPVSDVLTLASDANLADTV